MADTGQLKTTKNELVKQFVVYDLSSRPITMYEAREDTLHGGVCIKTQYSYIGATAQIEKRRESLAVWDSAWDMP
jgi:hypothetical protein